MEKYEQTANWYGGGGGQRCQTIIIIFIILSVFLYTRGAGSGGAVMFYDVERYTYKPTGISTCAPSEKDDNFF